MHAEFTEDGRVIISKEDFLKHFNQEQAPVTVVPKETALALQITDTLSSFGIPRNIKGFEFIREAVTLAVNDRSFIDKITSRLYPTVAEKYGTTPSRVERAIRHAIETGCCHNVSEMEIYFGRSIDVLSTKPTNSEFIATIADELRLRKSA